MTRRLPVVAAVALVVAAGVLSGGAPRQSVHALPAHAHLDMEEARPKFEPGVTARRDRVPVPDDSGPAAVVHRAGGVEVSAPAAKGSPRLLRTGVGAGEPTLGVTKNGTIFFQALAGGPQVLATDDGGKKWSDVSPKLGAMDRHPQSLDPFLYVDPGTDRVYTFDFFFGCSLLSFTDDGGETWTTTLGGCGLQDHQNLFTAPPVLSPTTVYPNVVYACSTQAGATIYSVATQCEKSLDGGITFAPTGSPPYVTERRPENDLGVDGYCHGAIGHGYGGPDGTIYVPKGLCGQPWLAISRDEGATWTRVQVADNGMPLGPHGVYEHEASVAADAKGNVYYFWIARNRLPYLAVSRDGGESWSKPLMVGPPGLEEAALPSLALGGPGKVAVVYMGSTNSPGKPFHESDDCKPDPVYCFSQLFFLGPEDPERYEKVTWNAYMTVTADALDRTPAFQSVSINDPSDPMVRGTCGPIRCKAVYDFLDVVIDRRGRPWGSFVDACLNACVTQGPNNS
ncbi:MAG: glycoside hydrolase, partial [Actinomycetota bacterium]|nr:glycoside hydrolase [Actinomycetota bacterium]